MDNTDKVVIGVLAFLFLSKKTTVTPPAVSDTPALDAPLPNLPEAFEIAYLASGDPANNPVGWTIADAQTISLLNQGLPASEAAVASLYHKLGYSGF